MQMISHLRAVTGLKPSRGCNHGDDDVANVGADIFGYKLRRRAPLGRMVDNGFVHV